MLPVRMTMSPLRAIHFKSHTPSNKKPSPRHEKPPLELLQWVVQETSKRL